MSAWRAEVLDHVRTQQNTPERSLAALERIARFDDIIDSKRGTRMSSDTTYEPSFGALRAALRTVFQNAKAKGRLPGFDWTGRYAHWLLRIPFAALLLQYGLQKFPGVFTDPAGYGVPAVLFILAAFAEVIGAAALIIGGVIETWRPSDRLTRLSGDVLTRLGGFAGTAAVAGVIIFFYWGALALTDAHVFYLVLAVFFALRGNATTARALGARTVT